MHKKFVLCFAVAFFFLNFGFVQAGVFINEVELYPTEGRFLELYNDGDSETDLTGWYIQRKTATGDSFGSLVSKTNFEGKAISAHGYFVVSKETLSSSDVVLDSLTLTESNSIQLKNAAGDVVDLLGWGDSGDCGSSCPSNPPDGKSIQKTSSGSWVVASPTPGAENADTLDDPDPDSGDESGGDNEDSPSDSGGSSSSNEKPPAIVNPTIKIKITADKLAFVGEPMEIDADIFGHYGEDIVLGKLYWSFSDGSSFEQIDSFEKFYHTYSYPGEYALFLEYYPRKSVEPEVSSKMIIKVVPKTVIISKVGDAKDFFVELSNNASSDIDVSNWMLSANGRLFYLPRNTVIMSKKPIMISGRLTGFTPNDKYDLKLLSATGELVYQYSGPRVASKSSVSGTASEGEALAPNPASSNSMSSVVPGALSANALESAGSQKSSSNFALSFGGLFVLLAASGGAVYFVRRNKPGIRPGDDFEILDE